MQSHSEKLRVYQPDGKTHAYWADERQWRHEIFIGKVEALGNKRRIYALRLKVTVKEFNRRFVEAGTAEQLRGIPVKHGRRDRGVNAVLAPSPRSGWAFKVAVFRNKQGRTDGERAYVEEMRKRASAA